MKPCNNCPFIIEPRFHFSRDRAQEIADSLRNDARFSCHKTIDYSEEGAGVVTSQSRWCAGALAVMENDPEFEYGCINNGHARVMARLGAFNPDEIQRENTYGSLAEFVRETSK